MSHAITRTSPKGGPFIGRCIKCGAEGLGMGAPLEACPADGIVSDEQALMEMLAAPIDWKGTSVALWRLLDDIDTQDDASRGNDLHFRNSTRDIQRKRFDILSGEEFERAARPAQPTVLPHHAGYEATRTDLSQASVAAALEAAANAAWLAGPSQDLAQEELSDIGKERRVMSMRCEAAIRALITPAQHDALAAHVAAEVAKARAEDAAVLAESRAYGLAMQEELRVRTAKLERECKLTQAQVDRMLVNSTQTHAKLDTLAEAAQALGAMPEGYCFCSKDRIGDDSKIHEPECRDLRNALAQIGAKP